MPRRRTHKGMSKTKSTCLPLEDGVQYTPDQDDNGDNRKPVERIHVHLPYHEVILIVGETGAPDGLYRVVMLTSMPFVLISTPATVCVHTSFLVKILIMQDPSVVTSSDQPLQYLLISCSRSAQSHTCSMICR